MTNSKRLLHNSIVFLLISVLFVGCGSSAITVDNVKELGSNHRSNTSDNPREIKSENRYPIIEIWQELDGSVPVRGKSLYFRIFDDGLVEFDYQLRKENKPGKQRYTFSIQRTPQTKISEAEFRKFKSMVEALSESHEIDAEYQPVALTLDVLTKLTVHLNPKESTGKVITINDADYDVTTGKYEKRFPGLLVELLKETQLLRASLQGKEPE